MGASLDGVCRQMEAAGLPPIRREDIAENLDSGRWIRYGKGKKAYYKLYGHTTSTGEIIVSYGTFGIGGGEPHQVQPESSIASRLSPEELAEVRRKAEAKQAEEKRRAAEKARLAANRAQDQWNKSLPTGDSAYLTRKQVARAESVRFMQGHEWGGWIIILLYRYDQGRVIGSQKIAPQALPNDGDKRFNAGMEMAGAACLLGDTPVDGDVIGIGEGYATCASGREGSDYRLPVYMALNAGNLGAVARIIRGLYPNSPIVFLADDDYLAKKDGTPNHVGKLMAELAAKEIGNATVLLPQFTAARRAHRDDETLPKLTDFNDLHIAEGIDAVRHQIGCALQGRGSVSAGSPPAPSDTAPAAVEHAQTDSAERHPNGCDPTGRGSEALGAPPHPHVDALAEGEIAGERPFAPFDAESEPPPAPSGDATGGDGVPSDEYMQRHWALVVGTTNVFDELTKTVLKKGAAIALVTKARYQAWLEGPKRTMPASDVARIRREQDGGVGVRQLSETLTRYTLLYGTTTVWDEQQRTRIGKDALRMALGSDLYKTWEGHPSRKQIDVEKLVFDPTRQCDAETHINLYDGLPLVPHPDHSKCSAIIDLVHSLCLGDGPESLEWLLNWMAYQVQNVGAKMDTAVLMHGSVNGTGKSMLWEAVFKPIFGQYGATLGQHQLESQYTDWRSRKLFVLFEEIATRVEKFNQMGAVKHMVTGQTHRINQKFVAEWEEANHMNIVILSNEFQPLPLDETDRRFLVVWTARLMPPDEQLAVQRELKNGGVEAFYHYLLARDVGSFNEHTKPPLTPAKQRLIDYGLPSYSHFLKAWRAGDLSYAPWCSALSTDVYAAYRRYCSQSGQRELSEPKALAQLGEHVKKDRYFHTAHGSRHQQTMFYITDPRDPALRREGYESQESWLGACAKRFSDRLRE